MTDQLDPPTASITDIGADDLLRSEGVTVAPVSYVLSDAPGPLDTEQLRVLDAWWRAANYLSVGQIYPSWIGRSGRRT
jgi:hypothetical protein